MERPRRSTRLRPRENSTANGNVTSGSGRDGNDHDDGNNHNDSNNGTSVVPGGRAVLADVSNRGTNKANNNKKSKPSRARTSNHESQSGLSELLPAEKKPPPPRRTSRTRSTKTAKTALTASTTSAAASTVTATSAAASTTDENKAGLKRPTDENHSQLMGRGSKRAKTEGKTAKTSKNQSSTQEAENIENIENVENSAHVENVAKNENVENDVHPTNRTAHPTNQTAIRTRSSSSSQQSQNAKLARRRTTYEDKKDRKDGKHWKDTSKDAFVTSFDAVPIITDEHYLVPIDFRLKRDSFDGHHHGHNYTYGIAHYDASGRSDPLLCKDYITDMFQYLYFAETRTHPETYMQDQDDINAKMRAILVDWLVEVHMKFRLVPETLYLCINIIDRYCAKVSVPRSKLQLIGVTALLVACKHEEIYPPEVRDCVYITDRAYDKQEVLDMEQSILRELDWRISVPTAWPFLHRFLGLVDATPMTRHAASYYLERTLQEHDLLEFRPSVVCCSAVILALNNPDIRIHEEDYQRKLPGLPKILMEYTEFDEDELVYVAGIIATKVAEEPITASRRQLVAVKKKYEHKKYLAVSSVVELPSVRYILENIHGNGGIGRE